MSWLSGWSSRQKIIIDHTKVDADCTSFPVKIIIPSTNPVISTAKADGTDIRFTSANGSTLLPFEREIHDAAQQIAVYHVKVPLVSSTADTEIYIYYGNSSAADASTPNDVWDSNYSMVLHMDPSLTDSTVNANDLTNYGTVAGLGSDGHYRVFDGSNDYLYRYSINSMWTTYFTSEIFIKTTDGAGMLWQINRSSSTFYKEALFLIASSGKLYFWDHDGSYGYNVYSNSTVNNGAWRTVGFSKNSTSGKFYIDGAVNRSVSGGHNVVYNNKYFAIGKDYRDNTNFLSCSMGEFRISKVTRSDAWVKATNATLTNTLLSFSEEEVLKSTTMMLAFNF